MPRVIYISGPITGVENYREAFNAVEERLTALGYIVLNPARLPQGMTDEQYMQIDLAMLNAADAVYFMTGWASSRGAALERSYCEYIGKPILHKFAKEVLNHDRVE